jgi:hypothetical protein
MCSVCGYSDTDKGSIEKCENKCLNWHNLWKDSKVGDLAYTQNKIAIIEKIVKANNYVKLILHNLSPYYITCATKIPIRPATKEDIENV